MIVVNKWDAIEKNDKTIYKYTNEVRNTLSYMPYAEIMFVSALTGQRLVKLFDMVDTIIENQTMRVQTGVLNEIMTEAVAMQQPPSDKGKRLRLYYITQVAVKPPTFVIFVNDKELMHFFLYKISGKQDQGSIRVPRNSAEIYYQRTWRKGEIKYDTSVMPCNRISVRIVPDKLYFRKSTWDRYPGIRKPQCRYDQYLAYHGTQKQVF